MSLNIEGFRNKSRKWKPAFESKGLKVNLGKTKVIVRTCKKAYRLACVSRMCFADQSIVGDNHIASRMRRNRPPSALVDTTRFKILVGFLLVLTRKIEKLVNCYKTFDLMENN